VRMCGLPGCPTLAARAAVARLTWKIDRRGYGRSERAELLMATIASGLNSELD
jgi:hypothetical protein